MTGRALTSSRTSPHRDRSRIVLGVVGGVAVAALVLVAGPGVGPAGAFAAPVLLAALAGRGLAAILRHRRRREGGRREPRGMSVGALVVVIGAVLLLATAAVSWGRAVLRPSNSSLSIRTVEWLRDTGGSGLVSEVERVYYSLTAPAKGGPTLHALPQVGLAGPPRSLQPLAAPRARRHRHLRRYRPPRVEPVIAPALRGEGVWTATQGRFARDPRPPIVVTAYRPDPSYPRVVAGLAWFNHRRTTVSLHPGIQEPPGAPDGQAGQVPLGARRALLATFNGGFKHQDGHGGFFAEGRLIEPLLTGQGTILGMRDGRVDVRAWHGGPRPGPGVAFARQNLALIVDHGTPNPNLSDGPQWGATLGNAVLVWRSGVGVDRRGNLLYAAGPELTVSGLARILIHAGAVRAVELDINSYWVTLNTYGSSGGRDARRLLPGMSRPAERYLSPDDRDFFAVYLR